MLRITRIIHDDDYVGTVRRTITAACKSQLVGPERAEALRKARRITGGVLVKRPPAGATVLKYAHNNRYVIPVDDKEKLVIV